MAQLLGDRVGSRGGLARREVGSVPGRVSWTIAELAEAGGFDHRPGGTGAVIRHELDGFARQPRSGGRRIRKQGETGELGEAVEHRDAQSRIGAGDGAAVVEQHLAQAHECVIHLTDLRRARLLVASDRADEIAAQRAGSDRETGE